MVTCLTRLGLQLHPKLLLEILWLMKHIRADDEHHHGCSEEQHKSMGLRSGMCNC